MSAPRSHMNAPVIADGSKAGGPPPSSAVKDTIGTVADALVTML